jgi:hypothetical protein
METMLANAILTNSILVISPIINSITTISTSVYNLIGHIKVTKNTHYTELIKMLNRTDIEATILLLQTIIIDISCLPHNKYFNNNKFIIIALNNVKEIITHLEAELHHIKEKINYNTSLYVMSNIRSYDLLANLEVIENKISVLDRRCEYLFKSLDLCKHFTNPECPAMER